MKETAYLINASRGAIVDERALADALKNHRIKGAALDVHEFEPNISADIAELPNIVITPHCCTNIAEVRVGMLHELLEGIRQLSEGRDAYNICLLYTSRTSPDTLTWTGTGSGFRFLT